MSDSKQLGDHCDYCPRVELVYDFGVVGLCLDAGIQMPPAPESLTCPQCGQTFFIEEPSHNLEEF